MEKLDNQHKNNFSVTLESIPTFVTAIGAIAVAFSVSYQLGYFYFIDLKLFALLAVEDILRNSLAFIPFAIFGIVISRLLSPERTKHPPRIINWIVVSKNPSFDVKMSLAFGLIFILLFDDWPYMLLYYSILVIGPWLTWLSRRVTSVNNREVLPVLAMVVIMFISGIANSKSALNSKEQLFEIELRTGSVLNANLLAVTADALLITQKPDDVIALPRREIKLVKRLSVSGPHAIFSPSVWWNWIIKKI